MTAADLLGTLGEHEHHPAADMAMQYVLAAMYRPDAGWPLLCESMASTALSGDRLSQVCYATMERLNRGEPVSDRYLLGLAWTMLEIEKSKKPKRRKNASDAKKHAEKRGEQAA